MQHSIITWFSVQSLTYLEGSMLLKTKPTNPLDRELFFSPIFDPHNVTRLRFILMLLSLLLVGLSGGCFPRGFSTNRFLLDILVLNAKPALKCNVCLSNYARCCLNRNTGSVGEHVAAESAWTWEDRSNTNTRTITKRETSGLVYRILVRC